MYTALELDMNNTYCEEIRFTGCNTDACPDNFTIGGCDFSRRPAVWYQVYIPTGAQFIEFEISNSTFADPVLGVLDDCDLNCSLGVCATSRF
ncbi:MAG: hypothetical protein R2771_15800 [Saprospiraceae bacterium]